MSASWKFTGVETSIENNATSEPNQTAVDVRKEIAKVKGENIFADDHFQSIATPAKRFRRQLRDKRQEKRAAELVQQDDEPIVKLENAAIECSKSVDSAVLGKYSIWWKENEHDNSDSTVQLMQDQMITARVYLSIAKVKNKLNLQQELEIRLKESQHALGDATADADLHHCAPEKIKAMGRTL